MKNVYLFLIAFFGSLGATAQGPGLLISEFHQNPSGTDSPFEYVELLAVADIDFSSTPYTIIVSNNGTATADGWIAGGSLTYAFEVNTGTVSVGDVVYVGGTSMAPTGTVLREIDTGSDPGDGGIGNSNSGGVFGNGGSNGDGIAIFDIPASAITPSTVPVDAIFYGSGLGAAVVSPTEGYETPVNDHYDGGKLEGADFVAVDEDLTLVSGVFDVSTNTFTTVRSFTDGAGTDGVSEIVLEGLPAPEVSFVFEEMTVEESIGMLSFDLSILGTSTSPSSVDVVVRGASTANESDFMLIDTTITFPAGFAGTMSFSLMIEEDFFEEQSEYIILGLDSMENAQAGSIDQFFLYINDNDLQIPQANNELDFELLTSFSNGVEGDNSAEIIAFDPVSQKLFIANSEANTIDFVDFSDPSVPVLLSSFNVDSIGAVNSIDVSDGTVIVALEAPIKQDPGFVLFLNTDANWLNLLEVGVLPDMLSFNHSGDQIVIACEGEPDDDYVVDPEGGISIIDITGPIEGLTIADVTQLNFNAFDSEEAALEADGVRIFGPGASVSQDLEPEGVTVMENDSIAWVTLQENNAVARVNIQSKEITDIMGLGTIDHSDFGFGLDASNETSGINIANFPISGMFQPDMISHFEVAGMTYLVTANEGDARDYDGFSEEERVDDLVLDSLTFLDRDFLQNEYLLGRLKTTSATGDTDGDGDIDEIHTYGTRSFSIWDESTGELVFDSGHWFEQIIANDPVFVNVFNASNGDGSVSVKNRSDDKGPEPEGVTTAEIDGNMYVFVSMERVGGVFAFNVNDPMNPRYVGYHNNRNATTNGPDRGAEGILFIDEDDSPNGNSLLILANEVSSTLSIYEINSCYDLSALSIETAAGETEFCENDSLEIFSSTTEALSYQWMLDGSDLAGETASNHFANEGGVYQLMFTNAAEACWGVTDSVLMIELPAPVPTIEIASGELVTETFDSYQWYFEGDPISGATSMTFEPTEDGDYSVVVTSADGCEGMATIDVDFMSVDLIEETSFTVYPNPTSGLLNITFGDATGSVVMNLRNVAGEILFQEVLKNDGLSPSSFDLSQFAKGIYFVEVVNEGSSQVKKVVYQ